MIKKVQMFDKMPEPEQGLHTESCEKAGKQGRNGENII